MNKNIKKVLQFLLLLVLLTIPLSLISLNSELIIGDEIWNFQNIVKIVDGRKMYVDCNIIITPIFYVIGYLFVKLITGTILGFRIYNIAIFLGLLLSSFLIFRSLKVDKIKSFTYTLLVFLFIMPYISVGANYNVLAETIFLLGVALFLNKDKVRYYNLCQGFLIFACIFTKQNIGLYYFTAIIISEIVIDKKKSIHYIIRETMVMSLCSLIAVIIMCVTGCFGGFLNYAILGMREFATNNYSIQDTVEIVVIGYLLIAICSYILGFLISKQDKENSNYFVVLSIYSIFLNFSALPIINLYHTSFSILINVIIFIYILEKLLLYKLNEKIIIAILIILFIFINSYGIICGYRASKNVKIKDYQDIYFSSNMSKELKIDLDEITTYIKEKEDEGIDVICITSDAAIYMTKLHKNHGELDLCFVGNLGYNGKENVLKKIKDVDNTEFLVNRNNYWQEYQEIRDWICKNYKCIGNIREINIYSK